MSPKPTNAYRPRLSIEIRQDQMDRLNAVLTHGQRKQLFGFIVDDLCEALEHYGQAVVAAIFTRAAKLGSISPDFRDPNDDQSPNFKVKHIERRD